MLTRSIQQEKGFLSSEVIPPVFQNSYFPSIDGLRALSILLVIISHIGMSYKTDINFDIAANLGVQFFFVISGFLITTLLMKEKIKTGTIALKNFYIRRFLRIIPVAYLYLIVVISCNYIFSLQLSFIYVFTSFIFVRNFFMTASGKDHITTHYWSLSVEEQFYFAFPLILKFSTKLYIAFLILIILLPLTINFDGEWILNQHQPIKNLVSLVINLQPISVGALLSIIIFKKIINVEVKYKVQALLFLLAAVIVLNFKLHLFPNLLKLIESFFFGLLIIINLRYSSNLLFRLLNSHLMKIIGALSYSLYIWQQPFTLNLTFFNSSNYMKSSANKLEIDILITIVSLVALSIVSYLSYYHFEKKFLRLKEKFK